METTNTARCFAPVFSQICKLLPETLTLELQRKAVYWAPETCWMKLSTFINNNINPSASNELSVKVYALLCNKSEEEMRQLFLANGDN